MDTGGGQPSGHYRKGRFFRSGAASAAEHQGGAKRGGRVPVFRAGILRRL